MPGWIGPACARCPWRHAGQQPSPETLVAQALGEIDPVPGALTPPIGVSTNFEQAADGSYHQGRVYTRRDNPTYE